MRIVRLCAGAVIAMLLVAAGFANAGIEQAGTTAANFLTLGSGARVLGMGGAALGLGDDLGSGAWNPGALGYMNHTEIVFSHSSLGDGTQQEWAAIGGRLRGGATRWSVSGLYHGQGSFEGRDASNLPTGDFSASSFAFGVHLAHRFGDAFSLGVGSKLVSENLGPVSGFGATFDFGATAHHGPFGIGVAATNIGGQMKYDGTPYRFPGNIGAGVAYALPLTGLRLALDANFPNAYYNDVRFGTEYLWNNVVAIRAGYRHEMSDGGDDLLSGPTFGLGAGWNGMWMDYGYLVSGTGEAQHRLGFRLFPGRIGVPSSPFGHSDSPSIAPPPPAPRRAAPQQEKPAAKPSVSAAGESKGSATATTTDKAEKTDKAENDAPATKSSAAPKSTTTTTKADVPATKAIAPAAGATVAPKSAPAATVTKAAAKADVKSEAKPAPTKVAADVKAPAKPAPAKTSAPVNAAKQPIAANVPPPTTETKPVEKPAEARPAETKPAEAKPVEAKPAETKPVEAKPAETKPAKSEPRPAKVKVKSGETLAAIGRQWNVSVASLMMENNLTNEKIQVGQTLKLPAAGR